MPLILHHPNTNVQAGAPKDWNEERDGPCATIPVIVDEANRLICLHMSFTPSELDRLNKGGSFRLVLHIPYVPVITPDVVEWPGQRFDEEGQFLLL